MSTQPARGMRDFLPEDVRRREYVVDVIRKVYDRYGFEPLETPAAENIETLLGKYGEEGSKLIFKILRRGEHEASGQADLALRYDLTVPLARVVAEYQSKLPRFFKRYQIQPVWRADRPARGRFREFYQCDIDSVGSTSPVVEAEQIAAVSEILTELGFLDFRIIINHRGILTGLLEAVEIPRDRHETALVALDKLDKIGDKGVEAEFVERGIGAEIAQRLMGMLRNIFAAYETVPGRDGVMVSIGRLDELRTILDSTTYKGAVDNLSDILKLVRATTAGPHVYLDPRLARGLSYYTGAIMEITVPDLGGSLGGGGRYDNLIGMFAGTDIPACGFSLGLERILVVMSERQMFPESIKGAALDYLVVATNALSSQDAMQIAAELRKRHRAEVYPDVVSVKKFEKVLKYVDVRKAKFIAAVERDENQNVIVNVRDVAKRERGTFTLEAFLQTHGVGLP